MSYRFLANLFAYGNLKYLDYESELEKCNYALSVGY